MIWTRQKRWRARLTSGARPNRCVATPPQPVSTEIRHQWLALADQYEDLARIYELFPF